LLHFKAFLFYLISSSEIFQKRMKNYSCTWWSRICIKWYI